MCKSEVQPFRGVRESPQIVVPPDLARVNQDLIGGFPPRLLFGLRDFFKEIVLKLFRCVLHPLAACAMSSLADLRRGCSSSGGVLPSFPP